MDNMDQDDEEFDCSYNEDDPSCLNETVASETSGVGISDVSLSEWDTSFSSVTVEPETSTPRKGRKTKKTTKKASEPTKEQPVFKPPSVPDQLFKCPECEKLVKSKQGLARHLLAHKWRALAAKQPAPADVQKHCVQSCKPVLESISSTAFAGEHGQQLVAYAEIVKTKMDTPEWCKLQEKLCQAIVKGVNVVTVKQKGAAFASTARFFSQKSIVTLISDREFLEDCVDMLMDVELCVVQVAHVFILDFLRKLNDCALTFIYRSMSGRLGVQAERMSRSKDDFNHLFNQKRLHYIAGSSAKSVVRHADRYPHNGRLQRRKKCVRNRLSVAGSSVVSQANKASHWTKLMNRKNLIFINETALPFFLEVAMLLQKMEKPDGSLGHEAIMEKILEMPHVISKWDQIIDGELCEEESFDLMVKLVRLMTNTFGRGIVLRRLNSQWKKGKGKKASLAISHRSKVLIKN